MAEIKIKVHEYHTLCYIIVYIIIIV